MLMYARATSTCIHQHINVARTYINIHQHTSTYHLYDINGLKIKSRIYHESFIFLLFSSKNIKINKYYIEINSSTFQNYPHIQALIPFSFFIKSLERTTFTQKLWHSGAWADRAWFTHQWRSLWVQKACLQTR